MRKWLARLAKGLFLAVLEGAVSVALQRSKQKLHKTDKLTVDQKRLVEDLLDETATNIRNDVDANT